MSINNNNSKDMFTDSQEYKTGRHKKQKKGTILDGTPATEEDFSEAARIYNRPATIAPEEEKKRLQTMKEEMKFSPPTEHKELAMSPLTAIYVLCRDNDFPPEFLTSLKSLSGMEKSKLLGVVQMITQMKKGNIGSLDEEFVATKASHGIFTDELILRVNGLNDKPVQSIDSPHLFRWLCSRFTPKVAIQKCQDSAIITIGDYCIYQFLDTKFTVKEKKDYSSTYIAEVKALADKFVDWTTWTTENCSSLTIGISSATAVPISVVKIEKSFYYMCISLLNLIALSIKDDVIVMSSLSSKVSTVPTFMAYNKEIRSSLGYRTAAKLLSDILGTNQCYDRGLFNFSPLSYILTYAKARDSSSFDAFHVADYKSISVPVYPSSVGFLDAKSTSDKASAYKNLKNIDSFFELQANNRRYRSIVDMRIQEYDTTYFVGPFERTVRRSYYLNQLFVGYSYINLGTGQEPKFFRSDPEAKGKRFYNLGIPEGPSSTDAFIDHIKDVIIPSTATNVVFYMPIVRHEGTSFLCKKMLAAGFNGVRMWPPDQRHSPFFPIEFDKSKPTGYNFNTAYSTFDDKTGDTVLGVIMFNSMLRVVQAERDYMIRVQLGLGNFYSGTYIDISELPEELLSLTTGVAFTEVEFVDASNYPGFKY